MGIFKSLLGPSAPERLSLSIAERAELDLNDVGNARRFLAEHGGEVLYVDGLGWAVWDDTRFAFRGGDSRALARVPVVPVELREQAAWIETNWQPPDEEIDALLAQMANPKRGKPRSLERDEAIMLLRVERAAAFRKFATESGNLRRAMNALEFAAVDCRKESRSSMRIRAPSSFRTGSSTSRATSPASRARSACSRSILRPVRHGAPAPSSTRRRAARGS